MTTDRPILWHVPMARSMRVRWLMEEIGLDYDLRELSFFDKSMRQPPYAQINPMGRVPSLQIDGVILRESGAAIEYLCETRAPELMRGPGQAGRADWLNWLHFAETIGQHLAGLTQQHIVLREDHMRSPTTMRLEAARLAKGLSIVGQAVADQDWLMPDGFSAVDCAIGYSVEIATRFVRLDDLPSVAAYLKRCRTRPAFQACLPADGKGPIYTRDFYEVPDA